MPQVKIEKNNKIKTELTVPTPECISLISEDEQPQPTDLKQNKKDKEQIIKQERSQYDNLRVHQVKQEITEPRNQVMKEHTQQVQEMNQSQCLTENEILMALDKYEKGLPTIQITTPTPKKKSPVFCYYNIIF